MAIHSQSPLHSDDPITLASEFLSEELTEVTRILRDIVNSDSRLIREVGDYINFSGGKKLRPILILLSARAFGPATPPPIQVAAALEAIHVATLLHDDVIDKATMRRGSVSVNDRWGNDVAILMADYLFAWAFDLTLDQLSHKPLRLVCQVTRRMCEGEMFQIEHRNQWLTTEDYLEIIAAKTANLFAACGALGGLSAGLGDTDVARLSAFGLDFGLAFQITDDALDFVASDRNWGKTIGMDLAEGKQTLPLILALRDASDEDRQRIETILSDGRNFNAIIETMQRYRSIDKTLEIARDYAARSLGHLEGIAVADHEAFEYLRLLTAHLSGRRF